MSGPWEETSWDELAQFGARRFVGVNGHATAVVDGTLTLVAVEVDGPFHENTSACIRKAINYALIGARERLARYLASDAGPDLPDSIRRVLDGATAPQSVDQDPPRDYEATRAGVLVKIDGRKCLVTWVDVPTPQHLRLLPDVVNAAITAAESRREGPPLADLFDATWDDIVGHLDDLGDELKAIADEHHDVQHPGRREFG